LSYLLPLFLNLPANDTNPNQQHPRQNTFTLLFRPKQQSGVLRLREPIQREEEAIHQDDRTYRAFRSAAPEVSPLRRLHENVRAASAQVNLIEMRKRNVREVAPEPEESRLRTLGANIQRMSRQIHLIERRERTSRGEVRERGGEVGPEQPTFLDRR